MKWKILISILLVAIVLVSGCAQRNAEVKEFKVKISHTGYIFYPYNATKPVLSPVVNLGDTVRFLVTTQTDEEDHNHGVAIDEFGINKAVRTANEKEPVVIEFVANKTGKFRVYCKTCSEGIFGEEHPELEAWLDVGK
ncbi:MAG TPA: hypothetical protein VJA47_06460 [archaeon]|nr:hypothetical protein [archaeon]